MARVTRSKKIEIPEDNTAFALLQTPLSATQTPTEQPLEELPQITNTMAEVENSLDAELKGLKAAYRTAIGTKKGKKSKSKKKTKQQVAKTEDASLHFTSQDDDKLGPIGNQLPEESPVVLNEDICSVKTLASDPGFASVNNRQCSEGSLGSLNQRLSTLRIQDLTEAAEATQQYDKPAGRNTRGHIAKVEAGQSFSPLKSSEVGNVKHPLGYVLSLWGGRAAPASRSAVHHPTTAQVTTDDSLLADKLFKKGMNVETTEVTGLVNQYSTPISDNRADTGECPAKLVRTLEEVESTEEAACPAFANDDSFVEQIICRSPAKPVLRIEDSVEALDRLEDAIEAVDQAALAERIVSPEKERQKSNIDRKKIKIETQKSVRQQLNPKFTTMRVKPTAPRATIVKRSASAMGKSAPALASGNQSRSQVPAKKAPAKRPTSLLPPKEPVKSAKPPTLPTKFELPGEAVARKLKEQREIRQAQRESSESSSQPSSAPKIKSTKAPTRPTFELPGEAISRRKREAHDQRLKAQEEEERKRREFKAKPLRKSVVPDFVPRDTAASRARQSKIGLDNIGPGSLFIAKRGSNVGAHRPSIAQITLANISAPRSPGPAIDRKPSTKSAGPSMSGLTTQRSVSSSDVQAQRQRAREIYNRDNKLAEDIEREKKEREAAAKRSREEAAEKGRQASREWAEKMRAKKMAEGDKGMGAGYGPGGQMGLRA